MQKYQQCKCFQKAVLFLFLIFFLVAVLQAEEKDLRLVVQTDRHSVLVTLVFGRGFGRYMFLLLPCELYTIRVLGISPCFPYLG